MAYTREDVLAWRGQDLVDNDGDKIGSIDDIYLDRETDQPEWAVVTTGLFGTKRTFVPLAEAQPSGDGVRVPYEKATVKDAPNIDPDGQLSHDEERTLYQHYGREYRDFDGGSGVLDRDEDRTDLDAGTTTRGDVDRDVDTTTRGEAGGPGHDTSGPNTDNAITRSEEELRVGTTERESGRVRLKKYVVEDQVTETVPVRREEVRVEREPITDANVDAALDGPDISEEEHEVVLHEEEVVAEKRTVPKERIRLEKDVETEQREVNETVRSERIDVDDQRA
ncbi:PRC and DUF2382 domain-containing protein [Solirubrobacter sp. CPCC 204708]|uniref:PRC and DUF2382 domain-containing protein n=1 Tax=Solirubrobacter deserti TaxID=2282478 RepID=A0ABT4RK08_9ACTN|nr:PRC and DUF2382 domain-containing protein [Solirubrobacter deserti]MBE2315778.1 PRC and DUF2382 domain-containing protein [Solirubrobacter deserti]MDA0138885.1 PRC and DUF2382 domain-containing protein [Solirubrobacter deserti]